MPFLTVEQPAPLSNAAPATPVPATFRKSLRLRSLLRVAPIRYGTVRLRVYSVRLWVQWDPTSVNPPDAGGVPNA